LVWSGRWRQCSPSEQGRADGEQQQPQGGWRRQERKHGADQQDRARRPREDAGAATGEREQRPPCGQQREGEEEARQQRLRAGASGFLLKDTPPARLAEAIRTVGGGDALLAPQITRRLVERFAAPRPETPEALDELTERELEVLRLIARGLSNAEIAQELVVSLPTVKTHVARILMKLGLRDRVQAVVFAHEAGVVRPGEGN
jgi:ATP/maltotriose-dependent transcriptional regulator MalT